MHLFNEGTHVRLYEKLGAHAAGGGCFFSVWAPDAGAVSVIGDFNGWTPGHDPLEPRARSGIWEGRVSGVSSGMRYKFHVVSRDGKKRTDKSDPFAFYAEEAPKSASVVWDLDYVWGDRSWMRKRAANNGLDAPLCVYEVHLGSWMRAADGEAFLSYRDVAGKLAHYAHEQGFTHVELLPIMEHPFYGSWGYQTTGYFAPTSRFGTPQDFMFLIDTLHKKGIGVILDWVPSHFPCDSHGLGVFDGTHLYEHADSRKGHHPDWDTFIYNYGRNEVRSFLVSSALFWLDKYHADGIRVDAVASMLYLDYSRKEGEWIPNAHGGRENLEAIAFIRRLNEEVYKNYPDVQMFAEESTAWPMVSRPTYVGGLGFGLKWDMGWMNDTLEYMMRDCVHRRHHHNELSFRMVYAFNENFLLPLSHDEVVHGKGSLLRKMPGDDWQRFANLRCLYGYMYGMPGKKLLFMGGEFAQWDEWNHDRSLDWHLLAFPPHKGMQALIKDLNGLYCAEPALHGQDFNPDGFDWIDCNDSSQSVLSFIRRSKDFKTVFLIVLNFTPIPRMNYRVGVPHGGLWQTMLNTDAEVYGGSGVGNPPLVDALPEPSHAREHSVLLALPPLSALFLKSEWK